VALTTNQYNQHVYNILLTCFPTVGNLNNIPDELRPSLIYLIKRIIQYKRAGAVDEADAAQRLANEIGVSLKGGSLTTAEIHLARMHWTEEAIEGGHGELGAG
jgi:hypothetical protein